MQEEPGFSSGAAPLDPVALISEGEDETPQRCGGEDEERLDIKSGVEESRGTEVLRKVGGQTSVE